MVSVLLATYNGAPYLDEQLASIENQTYPAIDIWISDDGSTDATLEVLECWRQKWSKGTFTILAGPRKGYAENFRSLIVNPAIVSEYYAFSDQDDHWESGKLAASVEWIKQNRESGPRLFCSRTLAVTEDGEAIGPSPLFKRKPDFRNALTQSLAGGNTMLFNRAAHDLLARTARRVGFVSHDWWVYLVISGAGGAVHYSPEMLVRYRQHVNNTFGSNIGTMARLRRLRLLFQGQLGEWTARNMEGLARNRDVLTEDAVRAFELYDRVRRSNPLGRLYYLVRSGAYRQTFIDQMGLYAAAIMGKI